MTVSMHGIPSNNSQPSYNYPPRAVFNAAAQYLMDEGYHPEDAAFIEWQEFTWPSSALGLPDYGMYYAQGVTTGYILQIRALDQLVWLHVSMDGGVIREGRTVDLTTGEIFDPEDVLANDAK